MPVSRSWVVVAAGLSASVVVCAMITLCKCFRSSAGGAGCAATMMARTEVPELEGTLGVHRSNVPESHRRVVSAGLDSNQGESAVGTAIASAVAIPSVDWLNRMAATFVGEQPDFYGLVHTWSVVAQNAVIAAGSVGSVEAVFEGELELMNGGPKARFQMSDNSCRIEMPASVEAQSRGVFSEAQIILRFQHKDGKVVSAEASVQFHPRIDGRSLLALHEGDELLTGWRLSRQAEHFVAISTAAWISNSGDVWVTGESRTRSPVVVAWGVDEAVVQTLLQKIVGTGQARRQNR